MHESAFADCTQVSGSQKAVRLLSEAEGCDKLADPIRFHSDLAIIELHRADAKLREASGVKLKRGLDFGTWQHRRGDERVLPASKWDLMFHADPGDTE